MRTSVDGTDSVRTFNESLRPSQGGPWAADHLNVNRADAVQRRRPDEGTVGARQCADAAEADKRQELRRPTQILDWLARDPSLEQLAEQFPAQWQRLSRDAAAHGTRSDDDLRRFVLQSLKPVSNKADHSRPRREIVEDEIRRRMMLEMLRQRDLAAETGRNAGVLRFNRFNGSIAQRLFFDHGLVRKPVSIAAYRVLWPILWQRRLLMPLVRSRGIYAFYSSRFVRQLARIIGDRPCLEIAAGDGTLARFLNGAGASVVATDDYSWNRYIAFDPTQVMRVDARKALRQHEPKVVVCAWPPPSNTFEQAVFLTASVDTYVVITSRSRADASNWDAYEAQSAFTMHCDKRLSRTILPGGRSTVLVFQRKTRLDQA
jgi:hypothetical protein